MTWCEISYQTKSWLEIIGVFGDCNQNKWLWPHCVETSHSCMMGPFLFMWGDRPLKTCPRSPRFFRRPSHSLIPPSRVLIEWYWNAAVGCAFWGRFGSQSYLRRFTLCQIYVYVYVFVFNAITLWTCFRYVQGCAKKYLLSSVTEVLSGLMGCA